MVQRYLRLYLTLTRLNQKMINFEYPAKLHESFVNLTTNNYDVIVWDGGRGGAKSQTFLLFCMIHYKPCYLIK